MSNALSDLSPAQKKVFDEWSDAHKAHIETYCLWFELGQALVVANKTLGIARLHCEEKNIPDECYVAVHQMAVDILSDLTPAQQEES
jgi:hypothetical protein